MANLAELISNVPNQGKLQLMSFSASEGLSRPFEYQVEFLSPKPDLKLEDFLGQSMTVAMHLPGEARRHFNGLVAQFYQSGRRTRQFFHYQAVLRPWFWFLSHNQNCRIFQNMRPLEIVTEVAGKHGAIVQLRKQCQATYAMREYCVQYRESDMHFIARLLEQEGIYYYFQHQAGGHEMVLCDSPSSHQSYPGYPTINYGANWAESDHGEFIQTWRIGTQVLPTSVVLQDFDYLQPASPLSASGHVPRGHALSKHEVFDYPGGYRKPDEGKSYAQIRAEEGQAGFVLASGDTDARGMSAGYTFKAKSLPDASQDKEYLVLSTDIYLEEGLQIGGDEGGEGTFKCQFQAMPTSHVFRPQRATPRPLIPGPQTATVVGPAGKPYQTDEHGRVKVLFHWDREGQKVKNETCSCWIRVSQPWAGKGFGMINIPRIGDEVVVSFLEADPDQPLITGRVYNKDFPPPYELPEQAAVTGVLTRSMGKDARDLANELRFNDDPSKEYIWLQAQKDFHRLVKNEDHDTVKADQFIQVDGNRQEKIGKALDQTVTGDVKASYGRDCHHQITGDWIAAAGGVIHLSAGQDVAMGANNSLHAKALNTITLEAGMSLTLKAGACTVVIGPSSISIDAPMVNINGGGSGSGANTPARPQAAKVPMADKDPLPPRKK